MGSCFFIGHRDAPDKLRSQLAEAVERHIILYGVTEFIVGHYGHFDHMAASAVREAKKRHPNVTLVLLLPYYPYTCSVSDYDETYYPNGMDHVPKPFAIVRANEHMIRTCEYLICYDVGYVGKTRDLVALARRREKKGLIHIENLFVPVSSLSLTSDASEQNACISRPVHTPNSV